MAIFYTDRLETLSCFWKYILNLCEETYQGTFFIFPCKHWQYNMSLNEFHMDTSVSGSTKKFSKCLKGIALKRYIMIKRNQMDWFRRACITNFRSVSNITLSIGQYHNTLCYRYKKLKEDLFLMEICINGKIFKGQSTMIFKVIQMDTLDLQGSVQRILKRILVKGY